MVTTDASVLAKPLLRGVLHQVAFFVALVAGALLIAASAGGTRERLSAAVFAASVAVCFGISALYHRVTWEPQVRRWMRRADHAGVYLLIAGTYTPVGLLALEGAWKWAVLGTVYAGAAAAIAIKFAWVDAPKWLAAGLGIALGWVAVIALPQLTTELGASGMALLAAGGLAYTAGAIIYARRKPDPFPHAFGYHELFHALTIVGVACQYVAIAFYVIHVGA